MKNRYLESASRGMAVEVTPYKPEDEIFQTVHLCQYLSELPEITEEETEMQTLEKKKQETQPEPFPQLLDNERKVISVSKNSLNG
jgi:hypothetical protein